MATYKVIQDIEAEDKLLGPLTLRQFIYAAIVAGSLFIMFKLVTINWLLILPLLPHTILLGILASPIGKDQSPEVWLLAKIRFFLKPQKRIWDQSGIKELVTVTAPKKIEKQLTDGLSQGEVKSRLQALANTIDSRGWAVKNVSVNLFAQPSYVLNQVGSDRLIDPSTLPQDVPSFGTVDVEDMLDEHASPTAQHFSQLLTASDQTRRQQIQSQMQQAGQANPSQPANYWFMNNTPQPQTPGQAAFSAAPVIAPGSEDASAPTVSKNEEKELLKKIHPVGKPKPEYGHMKRIDPKGAKKVERAPEPVAPQAPVPSPIVQSLASNNDLNVATIARQAEKAKEQNNGGEVVIKLR